MPNENNNSLLIVEFIEVENPTFFFKRAFCLMGCHLLAWSTIVTTSPGKLTSYHGTRATVAQMVTKEASLK